MSSASILFCIFLMTQSMQNVGANDEKEFELGKEEYFHVAVSFWKQPNSITGDIRATLICLGALIHPNRALVTKQFKDDLIPQKNIIVYTGKGYWDIHDIADVSSRPDIEDITIIGTDVIKGSSKFIITVLSAKTQVSSSLKVNFSEAPRGGEHDGVIVGWNKENGPVRNIIRISYSAKQIHSYKIKLQGENRDDDFCPGSLMVIGKNIIGLTYTQTGKKNVFRKITVGDDTRVKGYSKMYANDDAKSDVISRDEYSKVIVSLWEKNRENEEQKMLCFGAIVTSIIMMITKNCGENLGTLEHVGIMSGKNHSSVNSLDFIIKERSPKSARGHVSFLILKQDVEHSTVVELGFAYQTYVPVDNGVWIGLNKEEALQVAKVSIHFTRYAETKFKDVPNDNLRFHEGTLIIWGRMIVGVSSYVEEKLTNFKITVDEYADLKLIRDDIDYSRRRPSEAAPSSKRPCLEKS